MIMPQQQSNKNQNNRQNRNGKKNNTFKPLFNAYWIYLILTIAALFILLWKPDGLSSSEVSYTKFEQALDSGCVHKIKVVSNRNMLEAEADAQCTRRILNVKAKANDTASMQRLITRFPTIEAFAKDIDSAQVRGHFTGEVTYEEGRDWSFIFYTMLPIVVLVAFFILMSRRMSGSGMGGVFNVGRSKAQVFDKNNKDKVTFKDVAGLESAKQEVQEIVDFLKNPEKYTKLGGKIPKGALLVGPPGTGKTLLAKAVAGEANVPFFSLSGSDFVEMFVGVGASRVRDLFRQAKETKPCIIFIDEIDAVGRARGKNPNMTSNDERESTLNQLLTEMDGFGTNSGVIILAATNRADVLDKALLRAGRFDRQIHVDLPDVHERKEIFHVHLRPLKLNPNVDIDLLSRQTPGFSGADIANVCNEAALIAARNNRADVTKQDFLDAVDRIVGGLEKRNKVMTMEEKRAVAYHEAGHATVSWMLQYADPLVKVTIVPRGMALGAAWYLPEERQFTTREHILDEVCALLGGRASEKVFFNTASTGALNDLERATKQVYAMVAYYGMSDKLSNVSYYDTFNNEYAFTKPYSDDTAQLIDKEAERIINEQFERAKNILTEHADGVQQIAQILIEREVLFSDDVKAILGERPWKSRNDELLEDATQSKKKTLPETDTTKSTEQLTENADN